MSLEQLQAVIVIESIVLSMISGVFVFVLRLMLAPLREDIGDCKRELSINGTSDTLRSAVKDTKSKVEANTAELRATRAALDQHIRDSDGPH